MKIQRSANRGTRDKEQGIRGGKCPASPAPSCSSLIPYSLFLVASRAAFTLVETLAATVIIGMAITATVALSTTMALQEELSWRTTVGLNMQENASRLWQLGLTPTDIRKVLPQTLGNRALAEILDADASGNVVTFPLGNENATATENPTPPYPTTPTQAPYAHESSLAYLENCLGLTVAIKNFDGETDSTRSTTLYRPKTRPQ